MPPTATTMHGYISYGEKNIDGTGGSVEVTGSGTVSSLVVNLNNIIFDRETITNDPVDQVVFEGNIECN